MQALVQTERRDANWLDVGEWSYAELNVPPYPEPRVYKSVARAICRHAGEPGEVVLLIRGRLTWFNRDGLQRSELRGTEMIRQPPFPSNCEAAGPTMPIQEADPWRVQYFELAACPPR